MPDRLPVLTLGVGPVGLAAATALARAGVPVTVLEARCTTLREVAAALTARGVPAPAGGRAWHPMQVKRVVDACRGREDALRGPHSGSSR
ncbi:FAD-dependent monooxygenase [Roseicella aquatilis]|nr:FAD-dependent monooxygenase [Roseicella aquatilis]